MRDYADTAAELRARASIVTDSYDVDPYNAEKTAMLMEDAADAIEELLAKVPTWISVEDKERRPACGERVNLTDGIAVFEGFLSISGKWMISFGEFAATHWMPLPEPPKEVLPDGEV